MYEIPCYFMNTATNDFHNKKRTYHFYNKQKLLITRCKTSVSHCDDNKMPPHVLFSLAVKPLKWTSDDQKHNKPWHVCDRWRSLRDWLMAATDTMTWNLLQINKRKRKQENKPFTIETTKQPPYVNEKRFLGTFSQFSHHWQAFQKVHLTPDCNVSHCYYTLFFWLSRTRSEHPIMPERAQLEGEPHVKMSTESPLLFKCLNNPSSIFPVRLHYGFNSPTFILSDHFSPSFWPLEVVFLIVPSRFLCENYL